jgi:hypothetical protein
LRTFFIACAALVVAGCAGTGGVTHDAVPLVPQNVERVVSPAAISAQQEDALYPRSISPASFKPVPMPQTPILFRSQMANAARRIAPQSAGVLNWSQLSGESTKVAIAPDGSVWALSDQPKTSVNKNIWHYASGTWTNISGNGSAIAVGPTGTVYVVNGTTGDVWAYSGSTWSYLGGGARAVTAGADGAVYILSNADIASGDSAVWKYASGKWTQIAGSGSQLANSFDANTYKVPGVGTIAPKGFFLLNSTGQVFYYSPGTGYLQFPGESSGVAAVPGGLFQLKYPAVAAGEGLSYFDYTTGVSSAEPGTGTSIAAGPGSGGAGTQLYEVSATDIVSTASIGTVSFNDYTTFGYDNQRDVFNPNSTAITPASLPNLHLAWQAALGGGSDFGTQTQPILATEISGHSGVLFVGGGSGSEYAYDATSGALLWTKSFGQEAFSCGASNTGVVGMGGSAAYDPATRSIYVVGNSNSSVGAYAKNTLYHLDAATGTLLGSVAFTGAAVGSHEINFGRTSVTLSGSTAYVGSGSTCDVSSWRGRVVAVNVPAMTIANTFFTLWDPQNARGQGAQPWGGGGVWGWGGVSLDTSGHVIAATGNADTGDSTSHGTLAAPFVRAPLEYGGYAESVLELSANLATVVASNHPIPQSVYTYASDIDVQGTPIVFTPTGCGTMLAGQGKSGELSMYDEASIANGPVAQYQMSPSSAHNYFIGEPAYSPVAGLVFADVIQSTAPSLFSPGMIAVDPGCGHPAVAWKAAFGSSADSPRAVPAASAGGVVFAGAGNGVWALDATTGVILNGGQPFLQTGGVMRMPVTIDGDWVFVIDNNGNLYGFTTDARFTAIKAKYRPSSARQRWTWQDAN